MQDHSTTLTPSNTVLRAYKTELDPNDKQRTRLAKHAGAARFVYNWALADRIARFKAGEPTNHYEQKKRFNALKKEAYPWLGEVSYRAAEQAFANLDTAYKNFFARVRQGSKPGFPKFKSRKNGLGAFTLRVNIHVAPTRIKLPRLGWLRLKETGYLPTEGIRILSANISEYAGRWFVSLQVEQEVPIVKPPTGDTVIGVDLGIKMLATCSDGTTFENPKTLQRYEKQLAHLQREMCRRKKGSKNRNKTKRKVAKLHFKIANGRKHALHNVSHYLTAKAKPSTVVIEDLNVAGMVKNHKLAKAISDASFGELRRQLEYKCQWYGIDLIVANRFYPSSKTCSACGVVKPLLRLSERTFVCESCGVVIDRDLNAALNLAGTAKRAGIACGESVSLGLAKQFSGKQELGSRGCKSEMVPSGTHP